MSIQVATLCNSIYECFKFVKFLSSGKKEWMKKKSIPKVLPITTQFWHNTQSQCCHFKHIENSLLDFSVGCVSEYYENVNINLNIILPQVENVRKVQHFLKYI